MHCTERRDGMIIEWNAPIAMEDGIILRCDVFRPLHERPSPVILSYGAFGKGLAFQEGNKSAWDRMIAAFPEVARGSSCKYQVWEVVDPEKWVPEDYVCIRVDARGSGCSPGFLDPWSERETEDILHCIAWAARQPWSSGAVGMNGISYFAMNQWRVAARQPADLKAICVWEGAGDWYREVARHGGIYSGFLDNLYPRAFHRVQYGLGERGLRSRVTGEPVSGYETLSAEALRANRIDIERFVLDHNLDDATTKARSPDFGSIRIPLLSAANWGGQGLHPRGNFEGFLSAGSSLKWLEVHGDAHWSHFYTDYGVALQKRFFDRYLKGEDNGWEARPKVQLQVRHPGERFSQRDEVDWPIPRTRWTKFYLQPDGMKLDPAEPKSRAILDYDALGQGLEFSLVPQEGPLEITGPSAAKLFVSSSTNDADIFIVLRLFDPEGEEVTFIGSNDPRTPIGNGWLRASHRKIDVARSEPHRPYHAHDEIWPMQPEVPVELDVEIWPTSIVVPVGYRLSVAIRGKDYENKGPPLVLDGVRYSLTGVGPFLHVHPDDRPTDIFGGTNSLHFEPGRMPYLLLPVVPAQEETGDT